jgi:hypothetical protein
MLIGFLQNKAISVHINHAFLAPNTMRLLEWNMLMAQ